MCYDNYHFGGMHFFWWFLWIVMLLWIFVIPFDIPGQRNRKTLPLDVLRERLAAGKITDEEFQHKKKLIDSK